MISHHHACIFVHIPKCGGQSIETAFLQDIGLDWPRRAPLLLRANDNPDLGPPRLAHLRARDYVALKYVPQAMFDRYFTFAVVRNPYRRIVSAYQYLDVAMPFAAFLERWLEGDGAGDLAYFMAPQADYLTDAAGQVLVDEIYRLEDIAAGFAAIQRKTGLAVDLPHVNAAGEKAAPVAATRPRGLLGELRKGRRPAKDQHDRWQDYFADPGCRDRVLAFYGADFDLLDYSRAI